MPSIARFVSIALIGLAAGVWPCHGLAEEIRIGGTGAGLAALKMLAEAYQKSRPGTTFTVLPSLGSSGGIKAVASGAIQLAVSSRDLDDAERKQGLAAVEYGRTPFVFAVAANSQVDDITLAQLVDIYSGKTGQWPDGGKVRIVLRPVSDADSEMIRRMSPAMEAAKRQAEGRPGMLFAVTDQDAQDSLERVPGALGATSLGQIVAERRRLKALALDGVRPTPQNLANGRYPYAKVMFLVTSAHTPPAAQRFVEFVRSPAGRELLGRTGYWVR